MHPVLFRIGPVSVYSFGVMLSLGFLAALAVAFRRAPRYGLDPWLMVDMAVWLFLAGLVGSRLVFVLTAWQDFAGDSLRIFATWEGGVSFYGAILGGMVAAWVFARRRRLPFVRVADTLAPGLALAASIGRIGCFLNGCCYGLPTSGLWGTFTRFAPGLRHPTQLYESAAYLGVFLFLLWLERRRRLAPGQLFVAFAGSYLVARFFVEFFRDGARIYPWLTVTQAVSLGLGVFVAGAYVYLGWLHQPGGGRHVAGGRRTEAAAGGAGGPGGPGGPVGSDGSDGAPRAGEGPQS
ncbi:MAG: prolipoprotein diacylglyceryl transferase [Firmicutes bacterium]|nr:prolipoprotein diacylglyceryl transferase [Bacillota bacterium]